MKEFGLNFLSELNFDVINNIYNNIDKMPNLEVFKLYCINDKIEEDFYMKFVYKLLKLNLKHIWLDIKANKKDYAQENGYW